MTYKEFKALTDAYWLGWDNAQGTLGKDDVSHRSFLTLIQNIMMDEIVATERKQGKNISEDGFLCSVCTFGDFGGFHGYEPIFCPNCGAEMKND